MSELNSSSSSSAGADGSGLGGGGGGGAKPKATSLSSVSESPLQKQARIKTSSVIRLEKELSSYQEELSTQTAKVLKMRGDGADPHDIKQQVRLHPRVGRFYIVE